LLPQPIAADNIAIRLAAAHLSVQGLCLDHDFSALEPPPDWPANTWANRRKNSSENHDRPENQAMLWTVASRDECFGNDMKPRSEYMASAKSVGSGFLFTLQLHLAGLEPATCGSVDRRSIQLS
jgi:hypothetical protein